MSTLSEQLTHQFYEWEQRGRGYWVFPLPVDLEPPFEPFFFRSPKVQVEDDGLKETWLSTLAGSVKSLVSGSKKVAGEEEEPEVVEAFPATWDGPLNVLRITLPKAMKTRMEDFEHFLVMLSNCRAPVSFEILATDEEIRLQLVCAEPDAGYVESILKSYFPAYGAQNVGNMLVDFMDDDKYSYAVDLGLAEEFMRPLHMTKNFDPDPYIGLFSILEHVRSDEQVFIQVLFQHTQNSWASSILNAVTDNSGGVFFADAPEMLPLSREKVSTPLFAVVVRVIGQGSSTEHAQEVTGRISGALQKLSRSPYNALMPLSHAGYDPEDYITDVVFRQSRRLGMLLNSQELATLAHFPGESVHTAKLRRDVRKTKLAPKITEGHEHVLGINEHQGEGRYVTIASAQRLKHSHVIGATGTGKSTFLLGSIVQDIVQRKGVAVLDPHGDLIENILPHIPEERYSDVILIDPADAEFPVGFNILTAHSEIEKEILSSDLVAVFRRLSTSWGDQMNSVFANAILAFLESSTGGTLMDLRRFLIEKGFREQFLRTVQDPSIVYYWQKEYPLLKTSSVGPILTRLDAFLRPKLIRNMVAQRKSLNFEEILDSQKIVLIKLSQGLMGTENSYLLGSFIVSKIQQAAMARQAKSKEERPDFFLYIDEFQNFITPSMATILSGARKYHLGLILAHQDMQQLSKQDSELASSVISNAGTRICFRLGDLDAKRLADGFAYFEALDLRNLSTGEAIARIDRPEFDFNLTTDPMPEPEKDMAERASESIREHSRAQYGTLKAEVEAVLRDGEIYAPEHVVPEAPPKTAAVEEKPVYPSSENFGSAMKPPQEQKAQTQHRYLQTLIKKMAESRGYKALLEEPTPDGKGRVDVCLERNGKKIAVEITDTTKDEWELQNIEKCLLAGYDTVVECPTDRRTIERLKKKVEEAFALEKRDKILVMMPEELFLYLDSEIAKEASTEKRVKGYRVKVNYNPISESETSRIKGAIAKAVTGTPKKKKS